MQALPEKPVLLTVYGYFKVPVSHVQTRFKCSRFGVFTFKNPNFKGSRFKKGVPIQGSQVQNHRVDPKSTQSFIFPKSIKWVQAEVCNFIKKETLTRVFSCEFCEISKNTFLHRTSLVAAFTLSLQSVVLLSLLLPYQPLLLSYQPLLLPYQLSRSLIIQQVKTRRHVLSWWRNNAWNWQLFLPKIFEKLL